MKGKGTNLLSMINKKHEVKKKKVSETIPEDNALSDLVALVDAHQNCRNFLKEYGMLIP